MSGTSMDAIDAALVSFDKKTNLKLYREYPIDNSLKHQIRLVNEKSELGHIADLDHELGYLFAKAVNELLKEAKINSDEVIAIGNHGQTILHKPDATHRTSIQISDPMSFQYLSGAEIDYSEGMEGAQFVIRNPNAQTTCGCGSSFSV